MNILWAGGEDIDFPNGSAMPAVSTDALRFRSTYARCAVVGGYSGDIYASDLFPGGAITSCWLTVRYYMQYTNNTKWIGLGKSGEALGAGIWIGAAAATWNKITIWKYDGAAWTSLASEAGASWSTGVVHKFDIQIIDYGETATVNVYLNRNLVVTYTGDIRVGTMVSMDCVVYRSDVNDGFSEFIVADSDTRSLVLRTHSVNGAGDANAWSGADTDIDEIALSDADVVYTNAADLDIQCALTDSPAGSFTVIGIVEKVRAAKSADAFIQTLEIGVKSAGSIDVDAGHILTESWDTHSRIAYTINGGALTTALLDALQLDLQSET